MPRALMANIAAVGIAMTAALPGVDSPGTRAKSVPAADIVARLGSSAIRDGLRTPLDDLLAVRTIAITVNKMDAVTPVMPATEPDASKMLHPDCGQDCPKLITVSFPITIVLLFAETHGAA
ncbi:hypothetical protein GCM10023170_007450 [Phytohabitans houttuyneae]|uniref:Uncharacterized protein n=1 Tax=Phytohabitans houttuyneae TaxID=1076126 RepID=A0A6V8K9K7_9ACTN|nr:hypothetical protein Phou_033010 [Phytohabitans houttuyneae]